ncbi:MAG: dTDP-glucose 4,6-dehydratase [Victivallales bacterium]|nr:dTDP-glucose 4,6-dehydratase [Victivallales bacterium]
MHCILVTGGAGFIGLNFVKMLLRKHPEVKVVNLDALTYAGNLASLEDCMDNPMHCFVHGNILDKELVSFVIRRHCVEGVLNFAAESHVDRSIDAPRIFFETNVMGTLNLLECARECGVRRFLQVSTDEVYGSLGKEGAFSEDSPVKPNSPYSASKAAADHLVHSFYHTFGMDCVITRCSNNYGPYQFPEKMIPLCISNICKGIGIPVYGDGLHVRDWLYVEDHCVALWKVFNEADGGEVFNIGGCNERPNIETVKTLLSLLEADESLITFVKDRPGHDRRYAIDASKIMTQLGWRPSVCFEEGLAKTVKWYLDNQPWLEGIATGSYRKIKPPAFEDCRGSSADSG